MKNEEISLTLTRAVSMGEGGGTKVRLNWVPKRKKQRKRVEHVETSPEFCGKRETALRLVDKGFGSRELLFSSLLFPVLCQNGKLSEHVC